jgi:hypothetical protein
MPPANEKFTLRLIPPLDPFGRSTGTHGARASSTDADPASASDREGPVVRFAHWPDPPETVKIDRWSAGMTW